MNTFLWLNRKDNKKGTRKEGLFYFVMAKKRARSSRRRARDTLTGGTGDVKPQVLTITSGVPGAINDYTVKQAVLPITRMSSKGRMAMVFEILRVDWYIGLEDLADVAHTNWAFLATLTNRTSGEVSTIATMGADIIDPLVIAPCVKQVLSAVGFGKVAPVSIDLTDSNGNGILVATDRLFLVAGNVGGTIVSRATAKITYRQSNVGVMEYVGIVQSQQG